MFAAAGIHADERLIKSVLRLNKKFGRYHTLDLLNDGKALLEKCTDKRGKLYFYTSYNVNSLL